MINNISTNKQKLLVPEDYKLKFKNWIEKNNITINKDKEKLVKYQEAELNSKKYCDKKIRVLESRITFLEKENEFYKLKLIEIENNQFNIGYYPFLHQKKQYCFTECVNYKNAKLSRNQRIVKSNDQENQLKLLIEKGEKYETKLEKAKNKYQTLVKNKEKNGRGKIERIVKAGKKVEILKTKIQRNKINIEKCHERTLHIPNCLEKLQNYFSTIEYRKQKVIWGLIFLIPFFIGVGVFFLPSLIKTINWSFFSISILNGQLAFESNGLSNFVYLFQTYTIDSNNIFKVAIMNFALDLIVDLPIILIFSLIIATMLNTKFKGSLFVKAIFFIPVVFNYTVISDAINGSMGQMIESEMGSNFAFIDTLTNLLMESGIGKGFGEFIISAVNRIFTIVNLSGIQILIFTAALQSIPTNLYEAAKVEGATKYETFWKITFPMVSPILLTGAVFTVVDSAIRSPIYRFLTYAQTTSQNYGLASAIAVVYLLLNLLIIGLVIILMKGLVFYYDKR